MNKEDLDSADPSRVNRRTALKLLGVVGVSGLAGCANSGGETDTPTDTPRNETATQTDTPTDDTPTPTETPAGDTPTETPAGDTPTETPARDLTASFTVSPETVMLNEQATFDAADSSSPGASITSYDWDFGDGATATGQSASHSYDTAGSYDVTLTVTDDTGDTDTATTTVGVEESLPAGAIDPSNSITLSAPSAQEWTGVNPSSINGTSNPTLTLAEGVEYTMEWVNNTSFGHTLEIDTDTEPGGEVVDQPLSDEGYSFTFTATQDMVEYFCEPHRPLGMKGPIEVVTNE